MSIKVTEDKIIRDHVIWSIAAGFVPIPLADIAAVSYVQVDLVKDLCKLYDQDYSKVELQTWVASVAGSSLARFSASLVKGLPFFGTAAGAISMSILAGAATYAIGQVLVRHFASGGTIENFDISRMNKYYKMKFEEGKKVAKEYKGKFARKIKKARKLEAVEKLKDLENMKENGTITEDEFNTMKKKIMDEFMND